MNATRGFVDRLRQAHPLQYGFKGKVMILHTETVSDRSITDRLNRCPVCEEWSPCDVRQAADEIERLRLEVERLKGHIAIQHGWIDQLKADGDR